MALGALAGGADALMQVLQQKLREQQQRAQQAQFARKLAEDQRQADMMNAVQQRQLGQGDQRIGLDRSKLDEDTRQFDVSSGQRDRTITLDEQMQPVRIDNVRAQTGEILRKPQAELDERAFITNRDKSNQDFTATRDKTQYGYDLGKIAKQGDQSARVASIRGETVGTMPVRVTTVDEQGNPITKFISRQEATGNEFASAPTAEQRNKAAASGRSAPVLAAISELSERINTQKGAVAKVSGAVERAKAQANLSDDVSEYEAVVSGFTPMLARAVGHTGVLTEQDVQSVRKMLPQPGDSKSVRDRKVARITSLMGAVSGPGGTQAPAANDEATRAADLIKKYRPGG